MSRQNQDHEKSAVALMLSFAAASVDVVGYLSAYHMFTAHMTGNTIHLGNALFNGEGAEAALAAMVLVLFVCGSLLGRVLIEIGSRHKIRSIASWTFGIEAALLASVTSPVLGAFVPESSPRYLTIMLALLASAMGLQTATITRVGALTVHTTFVTGMINKLSQLLSQFSSILMTLRS